MKSRPTLMTVYDKVKVIDVAEIAAKENASIVSMQILEIEFEEGSLLTAINENNLNIPVDFFALCQKEKVIPTSLELEKKDCISVWIKCDQVESFKETVSKDFRVKKFALGKVFQAVMNSKGDWETLATYRRHNYPQYRFQGQS